MGCGSSTDAQTDRTGKNKENQRGHSTQEKDKKNQHEERETMYLHVDEHAKKAPSSLRNSVADLVKYLSIPSTQPQMLVRAFFVWISENIRYDTEGFFGKSTKAPCDEESVMRNGKSVCEGYANVMQVLCRQANIIVKKLSGHAKGYGHSADNPITTSTATNHAWNAVEINGKWFLLDSTWGAGHLDSSNQFKKEFDEFYFMTDPKQFVTTHFPYMDYDMEVSKRWQLLDKPIGLDEFNKMLKIHPHAFKLGVQPLSHLDGVVEMKNEVELTFESKGVLFTDGLFVKEKNTLTEKQNSTYGNMEDGLYKLRVHPHRTGTFHLKMFGKKESEQGSYSFLFEYILKCSRVDNSDFEFPKSYPQTQIDKCLLLEPLPNKIQGNRDVKFRLSSPFLQRIMINQTFLKKSGTTFAGIVKAGRPDTTLTIYGSRQQDGSLDGLFKFKLI